MSIAKAYELMSEVLREVNEDRDKLRHDPVTKDLEMETHRLLMELETAYHRHSYRSI